MSKKLNQSSCEACKQDAIILSEKEILELAPQIPSWKILEEENIKKLICSFAFLNYRESVEFTNNVANLADEQDHHPEIILEWGKVTVLWWSHKIQGLHKNDFICAAKTDEIYKSS